MERTGALFVVGGVVYCIHLGLVAVGALLVGFGRLAADLGWIVAGLTAFGGALLAAIVSSFLLAGGSFSLESAARGLSHLVPVTADGTAMISHRGNRAGFGLLGCGLAGMLTSILLAVVPGLGPTLSPEEIATVIAGALLGWLVSSLVLLVVFADLSEALSRVQSHLPGGTRRNAVRLRRYSYLNVLGVLGVAIPLGGLGMPTESSVGSALCIVGVGGFFGGIVVPMAGLLAVMNLIGAGLEMWGLSSPASAGGRG